ncbi:MAG TPA: HEAT repeat domain-containing protein [Dokdonella sp.]|uniref:HEAT repeat domain-containing protein n=1 Tax=Dokdonella sp. TaxID=2291710 RepID=UPI002D018709|nr:HEAT repeat domain-containing protein [Dokdonella sp.]HUD41151.1 HEAT repeat domain-containing protein [Dokdonella sp.]
MTFIRPSLLALALAFTAAPAFAVLDDGAMAPSDQAANRLYWQAQSALREADWSTALQRFEQLEQQLREREPQSADAALYWRAYVLVQLRRTTEARTLVERLHREYPSSRWGKDADALLTPGKPAAAAAGKTATSGEDDLADAAVEALLTASPERAIPLLDKVLKSQRPLRTKQRALFVLSQIGDPRALDRVIEVTRSTNDPALRAEAIRILGIGGDAHGVERLREIYASSQDASEKRQVIDAWLIADRKDLILAAARTESDATLRAHAVQMLGALGATDELGQLFDATADAESRAAIVRALGIAGEGTRVAAIAGDAKQPESVRAAALEAVALSGHGAELLGGLYAKAGSEALRDATLRAMLIAGDSAGLRRLYGEVRTPEEKKAVLRMLGTLDSDATLDLIERALGD